MPYRYTDMSQAQIEEFLQAPRFAIVGTNRRSGPPQLTPVWYLYENGKVYLPMLKKSVKYRNLSRDPRVGVCISGECPDARAVMIYGTVELTPRDREIVWRVVRRYRDSDEETQSYIDSLPPDEEAALAIVTPEKILAQDFN